MRKATFAIVSVLTLLLLNPIATFGTTKSDDGATPLRTSTYYLDVVRFHKVKFSTETANKTLRRVTQIFRTKSSSADVSCDVELLLSGDVETFSIGNGTIATKKELDEVFNVRGEVKIVDEISYCGGKTDASIVGCAQVSRYRQFISFVVERHLWESILWAHELLHTRGMSHRIGSCLLMNDRLMPTTEEIDKRECRSMIIPFTGPIPKGSIEVSSISPNRSDDILFFVRKLYVHGIPYEEAVSYSSNRAENVNKLLRALKDSDNEAFLSNIVAVLGIIGGEQAKNGLIQYIKNAKGRGLDPNEYRASLGAIVSLGHFVNRDGDEQVLRFLEELALEISDSRSEKAAQLEEQGFRVLVPEVVGRSAILGLSLGGSKESEEVLRSLEARDPNGEHRDLVQSALRTHKRISEQGIEANYRLTAE